MPTVARYDEQAEWYEKFADNAESHREAIQRILGHGAGWCLDLGCGTGHYFDILHSTGRAVVGLDFSVNQLRRAKSRNPRVVRSDAARLPFAAKAFSAVTAIWISTDIDDFGALAREAERVLRPGGQFLIYGAHPCFNGPCVENRDDGARIVHPTYRNSGWHEESPWWGENGIRSRVGMRHVQLAELFRGIIGAGLRIIDVREPGVEEIPHTLAVLAVAGR